MTKHFMGLVVAVACLALGVPDASAQRVTNLAAGVQHTCALTAAGGVVCWGDNSSGQLGDGTTTERWTPTAVSGLGSGVAGITAGFDYTCALTNAGGVWCWGYNWTGQLGDGTTADHPVPTPVIGLASGVAAIAAGYDHACALTTGRAVFCWGANEHGELGDSSTEMRLTPVPVAGLGGGVAAIAAGQAHTCAVTMAGGVLCWGWNASGQLGDETTADHVVPAPVSGLGGGVAAVAAGERHTCALTAGGSVACWGSYGWGQIGDGTGQPRLTPVPVSGLGSGVGAITAGRNHTCAVTSGGDAACWGGNDEGQLGDGTMEPRPTPVPVSGLGGGVAAVAAGEKHSCALTAGGRVACWGDNSAGQLGDGTSEVFVAPSPVSGLDSGVAAVASGNLHTCAVRADASVVCWGENGVGQLGDGTTERRPTPVRVSGLTIGAAATASGSSHTCALTTGGAVFCWGNNRWGQLGDGTTEAHLTPVPVNGLGSGVTAVAAGDVHTCALRTNGSVMCWGDNGYGQLGDNSPTASPVTTPVPVSGLGGVTAIAAGMWHTCALTAGGAVFCWGLNTEGQLGDGTTTDHPVPTPVNGLGSGVAAIAVGDRHTCALSTGGAVKCWGWNLHCQLGDGTTADHPVPVPVNGLGSSAAAIAAGGAHTCALTTGGAALCWGNNGFGQIGDGTISANRLAPTSVVGLEEGATAIAAGTWHTCALTPSGGVRCWGYNYWGQIGNGIPTRRLTPRFVHLLPTQPVLPTMATGWRHTCALTAFGGVACWGDNASGQLGDGTTTERWLPVLASGLASDVVSVTAGDRHSCALTAGGAALCWGDNSSGQVGDGTLQPRLTPTSVANLDTGTAMIAAGFEHTCALTAGGAVRCWGSNAGGQLGDGTTTTRLIAVPASGLASGVAAIAVGRYHTCALKTDGAVLCWGANDFGQLGNGTNATRLTPTPVTGLGSGIVMIAAGSYHTCAVTLDGRRLVLGAERRRPVG